MIEEWRDIVGYEGLYQVSNLGNVKSLDRETKGRIKGFKNKLKGKYLKPDLMRSGHLRVTLYKNGTNKHLQVHRLVALSFIENNDNKEFVNHLDENPSNNNVDNLEWATAQENTNWGTGIERRAKNQYKKIKVTYIDNTYEIWESQTIFAKEFKINISGINNVLNGRRTNYKGMIFEYV